MMCLAPAPRCVPMTLSRKSTTAPVGQDSDNTLTSATWMVRAFVQGGVGW